jgi:hypothetical protein
VTSSESFNAVIPLYLHPTHFQRVRILEGILLGHLYTLDSYGYDRCQEVAILHLLYQMHHTTQQNVENVPLQTLQTCIQNTSRSASLVKEFEKVCAWIVNESEGFRGAYGDAHKTVKMHHPQSYIDI